MVASDQTRPVSTRVLIARIAAGAIAASPAVDASADRRWVTLDGDERISGVVAAEAGGGRVDVALHLVSAWPPQPFEAQAERLRGNLTRLAAVAGLGARLGRVDVWFHDLRLPGETGERR